MQMDEGSHRVKWTSDEWPSHRIPNSNVKGKNLTVVDVPQSIANGSVQHLANNVEYVVRMVISAGCAQNEAQKVNNQE
jgi:hypothetical protein